MASVCKQKNRRYWYARYRDGRGVQRLVSTKIEHTPDAADVKERATKAAENRRLAQDVANRMEEAERGARTEAHLRKVFAEISERLTAKRMNFPSTRDYLVKWLDERSLSDGTRARYTTPFTRFLESLGVRADLPITEVTAEDVNTYARSRIAAGVGSSTVATDLKALNVPFGSALRAGLIPWNPILRAEPVEGASETRWPFTRAEVQKLIDATKGTEWETVVHIAAFAGLRLRDASNLRWENVDLFAGTLDFRPKKSERKKRDMFLPMAPSLRTHLLALARPDSGAGPICPSLEGKGTAGKSGLSMKFSRLMEKAKIDQVSIEAAGEGRTFNRKSFHSFRHFFVSELERNGVAPDLRQKLAGHLDARSHARYTHTEIDTLRKAVDGL